MDVIKVENLVKDYGNNRGVFDVSFNIDKGEVFGFLGPNGAGKTTAIRHLLGFSKPQSGSAFINGLDCWTSQKKIQASLGYISGEISLPENMTGNQFIDTVAEMRKIKNMDKARQLMQTFELDVRGNLKRMSKGMKQKIALVTAFMHNPDILILDEPTSGLDPLMQIRFVELIKAEQAAGKTIFMSSHMFEEVEKTCDRVAIIKQGKIATIVNMEEIRHIKTKIYEIKFDGLEQLNGFTKEPFDFIEVNPEKTRVKVQIKDSDINILLGVLAKYKVEYISEIKYNLEQHFMKFYKEDTANV